MSLHELHVRPLSHRLGASTGHADNNGNGGTGGVSREFNSRRGEVFVGATIGHVELPSDGSDSLLARKLGTGPSAEDEGLGAAGGDGAGGSVRLGDGGRGARTSRRPQKAVTTFDQSKSTVTFSSLTSRLY